jgi:hypothetical protein
MKFSLIVNIAASYTEAKYWKAGHLHNAFFEVNEVPPLMKDHLRVDIVGDSITDGPWPIFMSSMFNGKTYNNR